MPNMMAALPNMAAPSVQRLADTHYLTAVQQHCQDAKAVEIRWGAPNYGIDLSR